MTDEADADFEPAPILAAVEDEMKRHRGAGALQWRSFFVGFQLGRLKKLDEETVRSCLQTYLRGLGLKRRKDP